MEQAGPRVQCARRLACGVARGAALGGIPFRWGENGMPEPWLLFMSGDRKHNRRLSVCHISAGRWVRVAADLRRQTSMWLTHALVNAKASKESRGVSHTHGFIAVKVKNYLSVRGNREKNPRRHCLIVALFASLGVVPSVFA